MVRSVPRATKYIRKTWLKNHIEDVHAIVGEQCPSCDKRFKKKLSWMNHIEYVHMDIGEQCPLCVKLFLK